MKTGYRVFVASTYLDNEERRKIVTEAVMKAEMMPIGMERFAASSRRPLEQCQRLAREADVLVGIIAYRYGSVPDGSDKSITELEYEAQPERLMFLIDEHALITPSDAYDAPLGTEEFNLAQQRLRAFKERIRADQSPGKFDERNLGERILHALTTWRAEKLGESLEPKGYDPGRDLPEALSSRALNKLRTNSALLEDLVQLASALAPALDRPSVFLPHAGTAWDYFKERLLTADAMIADEGWESLSASDIACLVTTLLLHAVVVGLTPASFMQVVNGWGDSADDWRCRWSGFQAEAARFDGRQLMRLFGDTDPVRKVPKSAEGFTDRDRKLVGLFVSTHFGGLAGAFAKRVAVPYDSEKTLEFRLPRVSEVPEVSLGAIATVASSPGKPIREAFERLHHPFRREWGSVRVPYLIGLLNLSSFLSVRTERAPGTAMPEAQLVTPLCNSTLDRVTESFMTTGVEDDPEGLSVYVIPGSVRSYLSIRDTLDELQMVLDRAWAVIGEVYGRVQELRRLGYFIRRVRSNIDKPGELAAEVDYQPARIAFDSAGVDLLKLLVRPLYGNNPSIGVRELLQNAVDAAREIEHLRATAGLREDTSAERTEDVLINFEKASDGGWTLEVIDRGTGMTLDTVQNYFLRAGASYRRSDAWKASFQTSQGTSAVARTGRFGIGILAAFLLGDRIEVCTRHYSQPEDEGLFFAATVDDEFLTVRRANLPVGTRILIRIEDGEVARKLEFQKGWDWYSASAPRIRRVLNGIDLEQSSLVPNEPTDEWHSLDVTDFERVMWSHHHRRLFCNGIQIGLPGNVGSPYHGAFSRFPVSRFLKLISPGVSLYDPDGRLPLNLERTELNAPLPFEGELRESVTRQFASSLTTRIANQTATWPALVDELAPSNFREAVFYELRSVSCSAGFWFSRNGISFVDPQSFTDAGISRLVIVPVHKSLKTLVPEGFEACLPVYASSNSYHDLGFRLAKCFIDQSEHLSRALSAKGARILEALPPGSTYGAGFKKRIRQHNGEVEWQEGAWRCTRFGDAPASNLDLECLVADKDPDANWVMIELYLSSTDGKASDLQRAWQEHFGGPYAPLPEGLRSIVT